MPFITIKLPHKDLSVNLRDMAQKVSEASGLGLHQLNFYVERYGSLDYFTGTSEPMVAVQVTASRKNPQQTLHQILYAVSDEVKAQLHILNVGAFVVYIDDDMLLAHGKLR